MTISVLALTDRAWAMPLFWLIGPPSPSDLSEPRVCSEPEPGVAIFKVKKQPRPYGPGLLFYLLSAERGYKTEMTDIPTIDVKKIFKFLGAFIGGAIAVATLLVAAVALLLDHTTDTIITMEQDPGSGLVTVDIAPDGWMPGFADIFYQVDGSRSVRYSGPFRVGPEQTVTAYISMIPSLKWLTVAEAERVWDPSSYTASAGLWFMYDGSVLLSDSDGGGSEIIPRDFYGYVDLINTTRARLNVSAHDISQLYWAAVGAGSYRMDVTVCVDDVGDPNSVVWVSFASGGRQIASVMSDACLFMPCVTDFPALTVAELVGEPDGLDRKIAGRISDTVCDGQIVAVPVAGCCCLQVSQGEVWAGLDVSGWAGDALNFGACSGILLEGDQLQPKDRIYAEHFYTMLYRCEKETGACITEPVTLEPELDQWLDESFHWAMERKMLLPDDDGKYYVGRYLSRADLALMLYRYLPASWDWRIADGEIAFNWAEETGLLTQNDRGQDPEGPVTCEEALAVILRVCRLRAGLDGGKRLRIGAPKESEFLPCCPLPAEPPPFVISYA